MLKKFIFLPFCLSLSLSPLAYSQQAQIPHYAIEELAKKDLNDLAKVIKQLPEEEQALVKQVISEKKDGNISLLEAGLLVVAPIIAAIVIYKAWTYDGDWLEDRIG